MLYLEKTCINPFIFLRAFICDFQMKVIALHGRQTRYCHKEVPGI